MATDDLSLLRDAIVRNTAAVLTLPSAGMLRHRKTRFLALANDGLWVESIADDVPHINELIMMATPVGISFKAGSIKQMFTTQILQRIDEYRLNEQMVVHAARLALPDAIKPLQRRSTYRVPVPKNEGFSMDVWRIAPRVPLQDKPLHAAKLKVELIDLSMGGVGATFVGENGNPPLICESDRLRVLLKTDSIELLVEGAMRHPVPGADPMRLKAGIAFKTMENDLEGRQNLAKLARITGDLQRLEVRRARLGVA